MLHQMTRIVDGLQVYPERMRENMDRSYGLLFSQRVLLKLTDKRPGAPGGLRDGAAQRDARVAGAAAAFLELLAADPEVTAQLAPAELKACFDPGLVPAQRRRPSSGGRPARDSEVVKARVLVRLKPGILDVQGATVQRALGGLGFAEVRDVRVGKLIDARRWTGHAGPRRAVGSTRCARACSPTR